MRTQRDIIYICCLWKGNNICEGNWREKRVNELWGNWLSMRQPQFKGTQIVLTAILPKTKRPTMGSGHEQASLVKQWGSKYITDYIKRISAENNEAERIRWESHSTIDLLANSTWQKVKRIMLHAPTSSELPLLAVLEGWWLLSVKPMHFRMDFDVISSFTEADP